ncbi:hypothetical protein EOM39_07830 [Candidatus Gracilibacteria bacterium]|nr:hypothetical protein [Candidatus Gracilibacteria bacterium]
MGNTNTELENRIINLEKKLAKFSQPLAPRTGQYEGQTWYDSINKQLKAWDGKTWITI